MRFLRNNGLTIALLIAFLASMAGMIIAGYYHENEQLAQHGLQQISVGQYLTNENFLSALFENWESEWLQMATYVVLTAYLFQKGSAESRDPDEASEEGHESEKPRYPTWSRRSPLLRWLYRYSLGLVLVFLFIFSFVGHLIASHLAENAEAVLHGNDKQSLLQYIGGARFWFESFQNWQSEFVSTATLVVLSIFLRFKDSPESKPLSAGHDETGA
ncbi:DUF6766 family protein [Phyllobacterium sophorae]|uniref:Transmembrane protein n=1 Tax=Phyllobacterium sophorae TaxID=1520277 RepID=A0A2P7BF18_9HYPH|nr:DUF6766 family protein [Phyllobacterium sophorae]PSH65018.1 hypothetical protein CU103_08210 [Phyllobacterium sophorae]